MSVWTSDLSIVVPCLSLGESWHRLSMDLKESASIDDDEWMVGWINKAIFCRVEFSFVQMSVSTGIKLTLSALLDGKNINAGGHKLGLGLEFQA